MYILLIFKWISRYLWGERVEKRHRRGPRHKYSAEEVVFRVLNNALLYRVCEVVFGSDELLHATYVAKKLNINPGYAYILLKKLEKWGVLKGMKDPVNGKLAFKPSTSKVSQLLAEEIRKRKAKEIEEYIVSSTKVLSS